MLIPTLSAGMIRSVAVTILTATLVSSCAMTTPASRFYVLAAATPTTIPATDAPVVGIGPIQLPAYLDRPQIVTRRNDHELVISELHRWAEPLQSHVTATLAEDVQALRTDLRAIPYPWPTGTVVDRQVLVRITEMETGSDHRGTLSCQWELRDRRSGDLLRTGRAKIERESEGRDHSGRVATLSAALNELAQGIASLLPDGNAGVDSH
ncbi:MAG: putative lipoprotein YmbA [Hyphomicrobiaceae bacterium]|jgi:uncharacterized lipoprotein YmbA